MCLKLTKISISNINQVLPSLSGQVILISHRKALSEISVDLDTLHESFRSLFPEK